MAYGMLAQPQLEAEKIAAAKDRLQHRMEQDPSLPSMQPGGLLPAGMFGLANQQPQQQVAPSPPEAFQWGEGGARLTPDDITARRQIAQQQMATGMDFSPVKSWTQGLARVAQALVGGMENRKLDKISAQNAAQNQSIASLLTGGKATAADAAAAAVNPYASDDTRKLGLLQYQRLTPKPAEPAQPHYFETNNGSQGMIGPDGKPQILYKDPDPKVNFIPDGMGGGNWVAIPSLGSGGDPAPTAAALPTAPVGKITPIGGGAPSQGGATFLP